MPDLRDPTALLNAHWDDERGYCVPSPSRYPHLWLWDSCFHAVAWAHLGDRRAHRELEAVLAGQTHGGMVPHMRYGPAGPDTWLGPLRTTSSITQPPFFGHAIRVLSERGTRPSADLLARATAGLEWLWTRRRTEDDLLFVVHPWEAGNDHSPRWDDWGAPGRTAADYDRGARSAWNEQRMHDLTFDEDGAATASSTFEACPAGFNAYVAFNMVELAAVLEDAPLAARARRITHAMDERLWNPEEALWDDRARVGGGRSTTVPISDGIMGALVTDDRERAVAALCQLFDEDRFAAPHGPTNVARGHPAYDPRMYWRGAAWPQMNYLLWLALRRWGLEDEARDVAHRTRRAAATSGWAEYWDPETGAGLGAAPQTWTTLAAFMIDQDH